MSREHVREVGRYARFCDVVSGLGAGTVAGPRVRVHAVETIGAGKFGEIRVRGGDRSTFTRAQILGGIETEAGGRSARAADLASMIRGAEGMGGVFDHMQAVLDRGFMDLDAHRSAGEMHRDHSLEVGGLGVERLGREVEGVWLNVYQDWLKPVAHSGESG